jgi:hypothetical protein
VECGSLPFMRSVLLFSFGFLVYHLYLDLVCCSGSKNGNVDATIAAAMFKVKLQGSKY